MVRMRITIRLPRDRSKPGELDLIDDAGLLLLRGLPCLGKADNERAAKAGNPRRLPTKPYGDTPTGTYATATVATYAPPHPRMGAFAIPLEGIDGEALIARAERTGLAIHGGRGNVRLVPTFGCVRLFDDDMLALAVNIGKSTVTTTIETVPDDDLRAFARPGA